MSSKRQAAKSEVIEKLQSCQEYGDPERAESDASEALCEFLSALGHDDVVAEFKKIPSWGQS